MRRFDEDPEDRSEIVFETNDEGITDVVDLERVDWTEDAQ
jgi:hypothetical protein